MNPWSIWTSFKLLLDALVQIIAYFHVMIMHHIVAFALIVFLSVAGICSPSVDVVPTMCSMTPVKNYTIFRSARQEKTPCSFRYNPTLSLLLSFTALRQRDSNYCVQIGRASCRERV